MTEKSSIDISTIPLYLLVRRIVKQERLSFDQITDCLAACQNETDPVALRHNLVAQLFETRKTTVKLSKSDKKESDGAKETAFAVLHTHFNPVKYPLTRPLHYLLYPDAKRGQCPFFEGGPSFYSFVEVLKRAQAFPHSEKERKAQLRRENSDPWLLLDSLLERPRKR